MRHQKTISSWDLRPRSRSAALFEGDLATKAGRQCVFATFGPEKGCFCPLGSRGRLRVAGRRPGYLSLPTFCARIPKGSLVQAGEVGQAGRFSRRKRKQSERNSIDLDPNVNDYALPPFPLWHA